MEEAKTTPISSLDELATTLGMDTIAEWLRPLPVMQHAILSIAVLLCVFILLLIAKGLLWKRLEALSNKHKRIRWLAPLVKDMSGPFNIFLLLIALNISFGTLPTVLREMQAVTLTPKILLALFLVWMLDRITKITLTYAKMPAIIGDTNRNFVRSVTRIIILALAALILLDTAGVSISPLLASLGLGTLAVSLALQDTLGNFFNGLYLAAEKPIRVGDFIRISQDIEGWVRKIGWRNTYIEQFAGNTIVVPNSTIVTGTFINFHLPAAECAITLEVGVSYSSDLDLVERVCLETASEVMKSSPYGVSDFEPGIRFHTFGDSSINFFVILRADDYGNSFRLKSDYLKALHKAFIKHNIEIPFPQRVVHQAPEIAPKPKTSKRG